MKDFVLITGNQHKADHLRRWLDMPVEHHKVDLDEIQSLDARKVVEHKVRQAYEIMQKPVLVEDVSFVFEAMGHLPGPLIKWFLEDLGVLGLCKLADGLEHRRANISIVYAYYDGSAIEYFESGMKGSVSSKPRGTNGFGWNAVFIPEGSDKTYAEMTDEEVRPLSIRAQAIERLRLFLEQ
jgi:non-canonical purine NTP pyrophosphatase (RdgB/HAM1 family)